MFSDIVSLLSKSLHRAPRIKAESYFEICPRKQGRCLPKGEADQSGKKEEKVNDDGMKKQEDHAQSNIPDMLKDLISDEVSQSSVETAVKEVVSKEYPEITDLSLQEIDDGYDLVGWKDEIAERARQIEFTSSDEFKEWFDGSRVKDNDGKPLLVYHGTDAVFDEFRTQGKQRASDPMSKIGTMFVADPKAANRYGDNLIESYLSIKNPLRMSVSDIMEWNDEQGSIRYKHSKDELLIMLESSDADGIEFASATDKEIEDFGLDDEWDAKQFVILSPKQAKIYKNSGKENQSQTIQDDWQSRQEARDNARHALSEAIVKDEEVESRVEHLAKEWRERGLLTGNDFDESSAERPTAAAKAFIAAIDADHDLALQKFTEAGATDSDLSKLKKAKDRSRSTIGKKLESYSAKVEKVATTGQELLALADQEPEVEHPVEPEWSEADQQTEEGTERFDAEHEKWEQEVAKIDAKHEKEHAKWERSYEKLQGKLNVERGRLEDAFGDLDEAVQEGSDRFADESATLAERLEARLDDEDAKDAEPEGSEDEKALRVQRTKELPIQTKNLGGEPHKLGCVLAVLPDPVRKQIADWVLENIPDHDLATEGREARPHVTILYGFNGKNEKTLQRVKAMLVRNGPITIKFGELGLFKRGKDGDVLHIAVDSPELHELNAVLVGSFDVELTHPEYVPHVTLAYLDPAASAKYEGMKSPFGGQVVELRDAEWSGADGVRETIPLSFMPMFGKSLDVETKGEGERCQQGETTANTGCVTAAGESSKKPSPPTIEPKLASTPRYGEVFESPNGYRMTKVETSRGDRYVSRGAVSKRFWEVWRSPNRPNFVRVAKDEDAGYWMKLVWGRSVEEVEANVQELDKLEVQVKPIYKPYRQLTPNEMLHRQIDRDLRPYMKKAMSWLNQSRGGALVEPPKQVKLPTLLRNGSLFRKKALRPPIVSIMPSFGIKGEGERCERGETTTNTGCVTKEGESRKRASDESEPQPKPFSKQPETKSTIDADSLYDLSHETGKYWELLKALPERLSVKGEVRRKDKFGHNLYEADNDVRKAMKEHIVNDLANSPEMQALSYETMRYFGINFMGEGDVERTEQQFKTKAIKYLIDLWANTSGDSIINALKVQGRAAKMFELNNYYKDNKSPAYVIDSKENEVIDAFLKATYNHTQKLLKEAGIEEIVLYRGMGTNEGEPGTRKEPIQLQPLSSFSHDYGIARSFAIGVTDQDSLMMAVRVPREKIFSTALTGPGCLNEAEMIVFGGVHDALTVQSEVDLYQFPDDDEEFFGAFADQGKKVENVAS